MPKTPNSSQFECKRKRVRCGKKGGSRVPRKIGEDEETTTTTTTTTT
eukprot:CAMPEP_0204053868 /NCGR_PEP_ID=MMETSP0360-20130528/127505_1 /ASSEMBLY_ACC=CAM_ASM_000342 /TAXON_ID=268821 /ORGANISM="Scrippsiella Hangoei, Strain SHTV-5" /LENGTH=46 /DNA_ID= /DNA_START= /DNA_END= /DNA_ORIENTATION=